MRQEPHIIIVVEPRCDFHDADDRPTGERCTKDATHRIAWEDGRYSFGCDTSIPRRA